MNGDRVKKSCRSGKISGLAIVSAGLIAGYSGLDLFMSPGANESNAPHALSSLDKSMNRLAPLVAAAIRNGGGVKTASMATFFGGGNRFSNEEAATEPGQAANAQPNNQVGETVTISADANSNSSSGSGAVVDNNSAVTDLEALTPSAGVRVNRAAKSARNHFIPAPKIDRVIFLIAEDAELIRAEAEREAAQKKANPAGAGMDGDDMPALSQNPADYSTEEPEETDDGQTAANNEVVNDEAVNTEQADEPQAAQPLRARHQA